ncbi:MAG: c-type cytochrome, partial [Lentisphaeraceae bacterium]|nr:c-type cytochrome [Lentisphaeraceae bacterium]
FRDKRRDKVHGRIWRITAKNRPLVKKRTIVGASIPELLINLSSSERWVVDHSKRELIERGRKAVLPELDKWLTSKQSDLAKLHGLWLKVGLNTPDQSTINKLMNSSDGKIRAAVVRIAAQWGTRLAGFEQVIAKAIKDDHPRVRLEAVHATRSLKTTKAVELALLALDKPMDKTIDYSLKLTVMDLEEQWVGKTLFSGNIKHLSYAVSASKSEKALKSLYKAYQEGKVPAESELQVIRLIGELGGKAEQQELYMKLADEKLSADLKHVILSSLITASERKGIKPNVDNNILIKQISDKAVQTKVLKLLALWKVTEAQDQLILLAKSGNSKAIDCLASIGGKNVVMQLEKLVHSNLGSDLSLVSAAAITAIDRSKGIQLGVSSLAKLQKDVDPVVFFNKALSFKNGPTVLTKALADKKIDSSAALTGIRRANTIGRDVTALVAALTKAGELKPMKQQLSKEELATMVKAVQERGNPTIGEDIYRKRALACINCHAIGGAGPKIGPDLISIGASAPVDYIIESILQPSKKIKEGYHMTMVMTNDGQVMAGAEVSANKTEVIIRDALGNTQKVATRNIKSKQINNMSMMPPGLTGSLTDEEFVHLVSFLSQLGKEGDFKLSNKRYVTSYSSLTGKKTYSSSQSMNSKFWEQVDTYPWAPALTKVSGFLPLNESEGINTKPILLKFELDVLKAGKLSIKLSDGKNIRLINGKPEPFFIDTKTGMASTEVSKGKVSIIVCIKPNFASKSLRLELIDDQSTALVKFID